MLASIHVPVPRHSSRQLVDLVCGSHGSTWRNYFVFLYNSREKFSISRHETPRPILSHKALRSHANFRFHDVQRNDLEKLANGGRRSSTCDQVHSSSKHSTLVFSLNLCLALHQKTAVCVSLETIKLTLHDQPVQFHVGPMHKFLSF